jgi:hypothetical protein
VEPIPKTEQSYWNSEFTVIGVTGVLEQKPQLQESLKPTFSHCSNSPVKEMSSDEGQRTEISAM